MIEIDDLQRARKVPIGQIPDPDSSVSNRDFGGGPLPASAPGFGVDAVFEIAGCFDRAQIGAGILVAHWPGVLVHRRQEKRSTKLALARAGSLSFDPAVAAVGFRGHHRDVDTISGAHTFSEWPCLETIGRTSCLARSISCWSRLSDLRRNSLSRPFDGFGGLPALPGA
jgi:hypothetical protein